MATAMYGVSLMDYDQMQVVEFEVTYCKMRTPFYLLAWGITWHAWVFKIAPNVCASAI